MDGDDLRNRFRGDYSNPANTSTVRYSVPEPTPPSTGSPGTAPDKKSSRGLTIAILIIITVGSLAGGSVWYFMRDKGTSVPASVKSAVTLPVYIPEKLPMGYKLDENSYSVNGEIVSYYAVNTDGNKLIFNVQPRPPTFDYQTFYQKGLSGTEQFLAPSGQAAIGRAQNKLVGNLVTDTTWIILSSDTDKLLPSDFKTVLLNLKVSQ